MAVAGAVTAVDDMRAEWLEYRAHEDTMAAACGTVHAATAQLVREIAVLLARGWWQGDGIRSAAHDVSLRCNVSVPRARALVAIAARIDDLPVTFAAFAEGVLSEDSTAAIARRCPNHNDAEMAEFARHATVNQLRRVLRVYPLAPLPGDEPRVERRRIRTGLDAERGWRINGVLPGDEGAVVEGALDQARHHLEHDPEWPAGHPVTDADALLAICETYLTWGHRETAKAEQAHVYLHLDGRFDPGTPGVFHLGEVVDESLRRYLTCDSTLQVVYATDSRPVSIGRKQHTVPAAVRRLIEQRDGGCVIPGCTARRRLHIHHIRHWEHGGPTDEPNLVSLCRWHHRLHHDGLVRIEGTAGDLTITDSHGRPLRARPATPPAHPPAVPHNRFNRPTGERLSLRWLEFSEPPNAN